MGISIGLHSICYNTEPTLVAAFAAWEKVKNGALKDLVENVYISVQVAAFPETVNLGYPVHSEDHTEEILKELKDEGVIDSLTIHDNPVEEQILWSANLPYLQQFEPDLVWLLGSDEIFKVYEIRKIVEFIKRNLLTDGFRLNFKNYMGPNCANYDFVAPRIWNNKRNGGVARYWKDDLVVTGDGKFDHQLSFMTIPPKICTPDHWSWAVPRLPNEDYNDYLVRNAQFCKRKTAFSTMRYGMCSYVWNEDKMKLEFNPDYYNRLGKSLPQTVYDEIDN
jgi:hypothetical protein